MSDGPLYTGQVILPQIFISVDPMEGRRKGGRRKKGEGVNEFKGRTKEKIKTKENMKER